MAGGARGGPKKLGSPGTEETGGLNPGRPGMEEGIGLSDPGKRGVGMEGKGIGGNEGARVGNVGKFGSLGKYGSGRLVVLLTIEHARTMTSTETMNTFEVTITWPRLQLLTEDKKDANMGYLSCGEEVHCYVICLYRITMCEVSVCGLMLAQGVLL